ncbi:LytTR family two component transcriptional regulator [Chitinophaga skermanii]|uniref:LytTR family two component transcriptional regulator n=1 Tax=Chitinophaga skermanii TaxID=331697 RepID=A0A327QV70_9BACT|nr:response regulator transcription factor [Chitinophaga skermanii]RAJ08509.1 LytTR family two component transcriptional regulator [Chitinophaga skermanii]
MQLKALIIDDEPLAHDVIKELAQEVPYLQIVGDCYSATEAIIYLQQHPVDLLFLDIQMPKLSGLDFLRTLSKRPLVIITTAHHEYAVEGFELDVMDYIMKPFRFDRFLKATNKAWEQFKTQQTTSSSSTLPAATNAPASLFVKQDKRLVQIHLQDIYYVESYGNYVKIWLKDHAILTPKTMLSMEEALPVEQFVRIHKSYIVNKLNVDYIEGNMVVLKNKQSLLIGKSYKPLLKDFFE